MTDEEAPAAAAVDTAIPQATNGGSTTSSAVRDRKLSVVSKKFDVNGDGQLDEAEQAMRNLDQTGRGYLTNDKVYALMVEQMNLQKSVFKMKKVIIGLVVLVVILALSNLGTSFASAILAKDSTTNDQNELVSKETGEALATQSTHKVIVLNKDEDLSRRRKLACAIQGGEATGDCFYDTLGGTITENDGQIISRLCYNGQAVDIYFGENGQHKNICPASTDPPNTFIQPATPSFVYKGDDYPSDMQITTASEVIDLKSQRDADGEVTHYELTFTSPATITCEVCVASDGGASCSTAAEAGDLALVPAQCQCGGVEGYDPSNNCEQSYCDIMSCTEQMAWCSDCSTASRDGCTCDFSCSGGATVVYDEPTCGKVP